MAVGIKDIALAANVSVSTVGRVLHGNGYVSAEARECIEHAIAELGYVPDRRARALRTRHSGLIGSLVVPVENGLYRRINGSITDAVRASGKEIITLEIRPDGSDIDTVLDVFIGMHIEGLVITSCFCMTQERFERLHSEGIPVVCVERTYPGTPSDSLATEDEKSLYDAVTRAIRKGHRRIAFIGRTTDFSVEQERFRGYRHALRDAGIELKKEYTCLVEQYRTEDGRAAAEALLALPEPPTAVFTGADTLAAGVLQAFYAYGVRVPQNISLCGCDDMVSASLAPALDSVGLVVDDIGQTVMDLLLKRIEFPDRPFETHPIYTRYVDRGTVRVIDTTKGE